MAHHSFHPEAVAARTVKVERTTFYHELIRYRKTYSSQKAVVLFIINGIIIELYIPNGQKVRSVELLATPQLLNLNVANCLLTYN